MSKITFIFVGTLIDKGFMSLFQNHLVYMLNLDYSMVGKGIKNPNIGLYCPSIPNFIILGTLENAKSIAKMQHCRFGHPNTKTLQMI